MTFVRVLKTLHTFGAQFGSFVHMIMDINYIFGKHHCGRYEMRLLTEIKMIQQE